MSQIYRPNQPEQLIELIQWAVSSDTPLAVRGTGSKSAIGRPVQAEHILDLGGFSGITQYDPVELVLTAGAGTTMSEIIELLGKQNQMLAFEPPDYSGIFGFQGNADNNHNTDKPGSTSGTLGGTLAGNISGPRRFFAGAARDHFLGFKAVSGRGEPFKSGGRVVKNVTGFDLSKLMAGSWGTLGALWEVTVKVLPMPEQTRTLLIFDLTPQQAIGAMTVAVSSPHSVSGAAYLPAILASCSSVSYIASTGDSSITALRVEGPGPSVTYRLEALKKMFNSENHGLEELHGRNSAILWREVGNLSLFGNLSVLGSTAQVDNQSLYGNPQDQIWRLSLPPASACKTASALEALGVTRWLFDQAGGTLWLSCPQENINADQVRSTLASNHGHATLWRAEQSLRQRIAVFQPQQESLAALTRRVKRSFDPQGILNPGRMYADL